MFPHKILILIAAMAAIASAQQPPVKVNVINACAPSADEQKELSAALAKVPGNPAFSKDYEVSRGHSTLDPSTPIPGMETLPPGAISAADWVRVRREFPPATLFSNVQYSFSVDSTNMVETLVLRVREPKDLMQVSDRGQRFDGGFRGRDVVDQHAGVARQAGALWKVVSGAGALRGRGRNSVDRSKRV